MPAIQLPAVQPVEYRHPRADGAAETIGLTVFEGEYDDEGEIVGVGVFTGGFLG